MSRYVLVKPNGVVIPDTVVIYVDQYMGYYDIVVKGFMPVGDEEEYVGRIASRPFHYEMGLATREKIISQVIEWNTNSDGSISQKSYDRAMTRK